MWELNTRSFVPTFIRWFDSALLRSTASCRSILDFERALLGPGRVEMVDESNSFLRYETDLPEFDIFSLAN